MSVNLPRKLFVWLCQRFPLLLEWEEIESGRFYALVFLVAAAMVLRFFLALISLLS